MALIKEKTWKYGLTVNYWMVSSFNVNWNKIGGSPMYMNDTPNLSGITSVNIVGYTTKASRTANINDYVPECSVIKQLNGIFDNLDDIYNNLKISVTQNIMIHPEIMEIKDINGDVVVEHQDAEYEVSETNWFADAADDI